MGDSPKSPNDLTTVLMEITIYPESRYVCMSALLYLATRGQTGLVSFFNVMIENYICGSYVFVTIDQKL